MDFVAYILEIAMQFPLDPLLIALSILLLFLSGVLVRKNRALAAEVRERQAAERRHEAANRTLSQTLDRITDGFYALSRDWRYTYINRAAERKFGRPAEALVGRVIWEEFPELAQSDLWAAYHNAVAKQQPVRIERFSATMNIWVAVHAYPSPDGLSVYFRDLTPERALRAAEARLESIVALSPSAIFVKDLEGRYMHVNRAGERVLGLPAEQVIGRTDGELLPQPVAGALAQSDLAVLQTGMSAQIDQCIETGAGTQASIVSKFPLRDAAGRINGVCAIGMDVTERRAAQAKLADYATRLERLSRQLLAAQETELRRVARELHDEIGQSLTLLKLQLQNLHAGNNGAPSALIREARSGVDRLIELVRNLCTTLRPTVLDDLGLLPALLAKLAYFDAQAALRCTLQHDGIDGRRFPAEIETTAYRVVQEALTNVVRHAGTREAGIALWADDELLQVTIEDRGRGCDHAQARRSHTSGGLSGMEERARLAGGSLSVTAAAGAGTRITLELPLAGAAVRTAGLHA